MKLTYWVCAQDHDASCYNIRAKTRKEAKAMREATGCADNYGKPEKVIIRYKDAFDLMNICMAEGGPSEPIKE